MKIQILSEKEFINGNFKDFPKFDISAVSNIDNKLCIYKYNVGQPHPTKAALIINDDETLIVCDTLQIKDEILKFLLT